MTGWTTSAEVRARLQRRWDDGTLLRARAAGEPFPTVTVGLRRPRAGEVGERLGEVQAWVAELSRGSRGGARFRLETTPVGGRLIGRNDLPARAVVDRYDQAWSLLGTSAEVGRFDDVLAVTAADEAARRWAVAHPLRAIELRESWPALLAAHRWLRAHRGSGRYLREIDAPGVDTKLVERHRGVLAALLGVPSGATSFTNGLGLAAKPELVRLRLDAGLGAFGPLTDVTARVDELRDAGVAAQSALVVENEVTFLSVPVPPGGVVVWGKGFEVGRAGSLPWLRDTEVHYWGDLDSHGFAILDQLRAWLPHTRSLLMTRETLLHHRERWGTDVTPTRAHLRRLDPAEAALYDDLVCDRLGDRVRLEQERIDWAWASERLPPT